MSLTVLQVLAGIGIVTLSAALGTAVGWTITWVKRVNRELRELDAEIRYNKETTDEKMHQIRSALHEKTGKL